MRDEQTRARAAPPQCELDFRFVHEPEAGPAWKKLFREFWPAYRRWYYGSAAAGTRPDYASCLRMLRRHLPAMMPVHERLVELAGGGDDVARFLTLYGPPPSIRGCTQVVWRRGEAISLIRNYDFGPRLCDGVVLRSAWSNVDVIALTDCLVGALDGINAHGLAVALSFGGDPQVTDGFGTQMLVRAMLESCATVAEGVALVRDVPVHMAYTVTLVDRNRDHATVYLRPGRPIEVTAREVAANHQGEVTWPAHARVSRTVERQRMAERLLEDVDGPSDAQALAEQFLRPPLYRRDYGRKSGTLYTAIYTPAAGTLDLLWPDVHRRVGFDSFSSAVHLARYSDEADTTAPGATRTGPDEC